MIINEDYDSLDLPIVTFVLKLSFKSSKIRFFNHNLNIINHYNSIKGV